MSIATYGPTDGQTISSEYHKQPLYKILRADGCSTERGARWNLPRPDPLAGPTWFVPGLWMEPVRGPLEICRNGYHVACAYDVLYWHSDGNLIYRAEIGFDQEGGFNKLAARQARLLYPVNLTIPMIKKCARDAGERAHASGRWKEEPYSTELDQLLAAETLTGATFWFTQVVSQLTSEKYIGDLWLTEGRWISNRLSEYMEGTATP